MSQQKLFSYIHHSYFFVVVGLALTILNYLPYLILGQESAVLVHDNLDSNIAWYKVVLDSVGWLSAPDAIIPNTLNGLPRSSLSSFYDLAFISFDLFGMYYGYIANKMILSFTAFCGMFLLLRTWVIPSHNNWPIHYIVSILFALLPFWSFSLNIAAIPFVLHAFCSILYNKSNWFSWAVVVIYPFGSSVVFVGVFVMSILACLWLHNLWVNKAFSSKFLLAVAVLIACYIISHLPLINSFIFSDGHLSHRTAFNLQLLNFEDAVYQSNWLFRKGQYHTHSMHFLFIPLILLAKGLQLIYGQKNYLYDVLLLLTGVFAIIYGLVGWESAKPIIDSIANIVPIQLQRFHIFYPIIWYLLLALALQSIKKNIKYGIAILVFVFIIQFDNLWNERELNGSAKFSEYYAEQLYADVKQFINKPTNTYKVVSIGLDPMVALYNGMHTCDGYFTDYPLSYKKKFRKIIAQELDKSESLKNYFDNWGSRCYAFSNEYGLNMMNGKVDTISSLTINTTEAVNLGVDYVLSGVPIKNAIANNLELQQYFTEPNSYWKIYLYKTAP